MDVLNALSRGNWLGCDRGSLESVGGVTNVGLFLSLLMNQLNQLTEKYARV
ncbi:MAG: hypothetical protein AAF609_12485 [Cyanobacteria bacterium P01_C01_bin.120]